MSIYLVAIWMSIYLVAIWMSIYLVAVCMSIMVQHSNWTSWPCCFCLLACTLLPHQSKFMPPAPITRQLNTVSSLKKTNPLTICSEDGESVTKSIGCAGWLWTTSNQAFFSSITAAASCFLMCLGFPYMSQKSYPSLLKLPSLVLDRCSIQITHHSITRIQFSQIPRTWKAMKSPKSQERERRHLQAAKQLFLLELNTRFLSHSRWREMKYLNYGEIGRGNCSLECCQNCQPLHHPQSRHIYEDKRGKKKICCKLQLPINEIQKLL